MTDLDAPLRGPALYNPHLLSRGELVALFAAREGLLEELLTDLRETRPGACAQHHLVIGQRGMGKTMLLRRIQVAIEEDSELARVWLPLTFPEEQYNIATLSDFWLNCLDALSDVLERGERGEEADTIDRRLEEIRRASDETRRATAALEAMVEAASRLDRRLLLLVDNADLVFERIGEQDWALREVLSSRPEVTFLGASAAMLETTYEYGKAFYDFFRVHELAGLGIEETKRFLLRYADAQENAEVREVVEQDPGRLRTLHTLTGGNPRTLVLLFNIFSRGPDGDVRADLEQLLDQCTPLYKARFEALPAQAQQVVDALALHWDPVSAAELADSLRMKVNQVSAQLNRLHGMGIVEKVPYDPASKTGFQIAERFFNIWYLMRASRRVRRRLLWLVEFLRAFYGEEHLRAGIQQYLREGKDLPAAEALMRLEYGFALAAAAGDDLGRILELGLLHSVATHDELAERLDELVPIGERSYAVQTRAEHLARMKRLRKMLAEVPDQRFHELGVPSRAALLQMALPIEVKEGAALSLQDESPLHELLGSYRDLVTTSFDRQQAWIKRLFPRDDDGLLLREALEKKWMLSLDDVEGAELAEEALHSVELTPIALIFRRIFSCDAKAVEPLEARLVEAQSFIPFRCWIMLSGAESTTRMAQGFDLAVKSIVSELSGKPGPELVKEESLDRLKYALCALSGLTVLSVWEDAWASAERILRLWNRGEPQRFYPPLLVFFRETVAAGQVREAADLLDKLTLDVAWRPLREALEAIIRGSDDYLRRVAPEVRKPAEEILEELRKPLPPLES